MRLVVTRPEPDAGFLAEILTGLNHEVVVEPMLDVRFHEEFELPADRFQAVIFTSANGVRAMARRDNFRDFLDIPVLTVGLASAEAARRSGFEDVTGAQGGLEALREEIGATLDVRGRPLLYATGRHVSGDLAGSLRGAGYRVNRVVLYEAVPVTSLSIGLGVMIGEGSLDGVLLFSRRTALVWADLVEAAGLAGRLRGVRHLCLSGPIGDLLRERFGFAVPHIAVARRPDTEALLDLLRG